MGGKGQHDNDRTEHNTYYKHTIAQSCSLEIFTLNSALEKSHYTVILEKKFIGLLIFTDILEIADAKILQSPL